MSFIPYIMAIASGLFLVISAGLAVMEGTFNPLESAAAVCAPVLALALFKMASRVPAQKSGKRR